MTRASVGRPGLTTLVALAFTVALGAVAAARLDVDNTPPAWLPTADAALDDYRAFRATFGEDAFVLAMPRAEVDLDDPAALARLADVADALARLEGVVRVISPARRGSLVERLRADLPAQLDALARAVERAPEGEARRALQLLLARSSAAQAFALLHDADRPRAVAEYRRAQRAALDALRDRPDALHALAMPKVAPEAVTAALGALPPDADPAPVFWWAFARGAEVRATPGDVALLADLGRVDAAMDWVLARDEGLFGGGPHLFKAMRLATLSKALGGDPERAREHFAACRRLGHGLDLLPWVLEAEAVAPALAAAPAGSGREALLAAQRRAWDLFRANLEQVRLAPRDYDAANPVGNAVARERAAALLADPAGHGVIPPDGAPAAEAAPPVAAYLDPDPSTRLLVGEGRRRAALLVTFAPALPPAGRRALLDRVEATLAAGDPGGFWLCGPEVVTHDLDHASQTSFGGLFPLVFVLMCLVLRWALGSWRAVLALQAAAAVTVVVTLGALAAAGRTLNMILVVLPAILAVVSTAYAQHLVARFLDPEMARPTHAEAWEAAARDVWRPSLMCMLTTAAGFLSLCTSTIPPVRDLGLFAAVGVVVAFGAAFTLVPALLSLGRPLAAGARPPTLIPEERAVRVAAAIGRHAGALVALGALAAAVAAFGVGRLRVESVILDFFPADHRLPRGTHAVQEHLFGLTPVELWVRGPRARVTSPEAVAALERFTARAREEPLVSRVASPLALLPGEDVLPGPARAALLASVLEDLAPPGRPVDPRLAGRVATDGDALDLRLTLLCASASSEACHDLADRLAVDVARAGFPLEVRPRLTGTVHLLVRVQVLLVQTQVRSFGGSLLIVGLLLLVAFRSPGAALLSLVPNVLPIGLTLGAMGLLEIPLNTATVTVAGIALGLVVDDTIHVLHRLRERPPGTALLDAIRRTHVVVGHSVLTTSVVLVVGFGAFVVAPFRPTRYFGLLVALTAGAALVCVLVLLPALLVVLERVRGGPPGPAPAPPAGPAPAPLAGPAPAAPAPPGA